jgi:hypothetical protein
VPRLATAAILVLCAPWPAGAAPAHRAQSDIPAPTEARYVCRGIASHKGWEDVRTTSRGRDRQDRLVVAVHGRRDGRAREAECRYNLRNGTAKFVERWPRR